MTIQELTSKAGKARQASMTPKERKAFSQKGVDARAERRAAKAAKAKKNGK